MLVRNAGGEGPQVFLGRGSPESLSGMSVLNAGAEGPRIFLGRAHHRQTGGESSTLVKVLDRDDPRSLAMTSAPHYWGKGNDRPSTTLSLGPREDSGT
jgi:hypothetical protein